MASKKLDVATLNAVGGQAGYSELTKCRTAFSAFTLAALCAVGLLNISAKGNPTKGRRKYLAGNLRALTGSTMVSYWTTKGRLDDDGLTVQGLNEVQRRITDERYSYRTNTEAVAAFLVGINTGKDVEIEGHKFPMGKAATVRAKQKAVQDDSLDLPVR